MAVKPCTFYQKLITSNKIQHIIKNSIILLWENKQKVPNVTDLQQFAQTKLVGNSKTLKQQNKVKLLHLPGHVQHRQCSLDLSCNLSPRWFNEQNVDCGMLVQWLLVQLIDGNKLLTNYFSLILDVQSSQQATLTVERVL